MIDTTINAELSACMENLPVEKQRQVLEFARTLASRPIKGVAGRVLLKYAGTIEESDLELMAKAIEDGCERVDANEW